MFAQKIYTKNFIIELLHFAKVLHTGLFGFVIGIVELHFSIDPALLPKHWNRTSDLKMRKTVIVDEDNLFSFTKISNVSLGIEPSCIVSSASFLPGSSGDQIVVDLLSYAGEK